MQHLVKRSAARLRRRVVPFLLGAAVLAAVAYFFWPTRGRRADLQLVALDANGRFASSLAIPREWADTAFPGHYGAAARLPVILAVRNTGSRAAQPARLALSLPDRYRLVTSDGRELPHEYAAGNPLIRYMVEAKLPRAEPGRLPAVLATDTLWIEPMVPSLYCVAIGDSIPEFVPAAPADPAVLSRVRIFYSFEGEELRGRHAGLLDLQLDPTLLRAPEVERPPEFPAEVAEPQQPLPEMGSLYFAGESQARCGPPEEPMEILSTVWETPAGGRFLSLTYGSAARKYLFDLDRDGIVELEMWDPDGDGKFEARRQARYPIPAFLLPPPPPPPFNTAVFDSLPPDSLARLQRFRGDGTYRPRRVASGDSATALDRFRDPFGYRPQASASGTPSPAGGAAAPAPSAATEGAAPAAPPPGVRILGRPVDTLPRDTSRRPRR